MSHSHLPARHLLRQIESDRARQTRRDIRPEWLTAFVEWTAELFEPADELGRVGFDCRADSEGWVVAMYLGAVELVGGKQDGTSRHGDFHFDIGPLLERFSRIDELCWTVSPHDQDAQAEPNSVSILMVAGLVDGHPIRLRLLSTAPSRSGPGLRRYADGRVELA
jgi:hypothetical protein